MELLLLYLWMKLPTLAVLNGLAILLCSGVGNLHCCWCGSGAVLCNRPAGRQYS